jgi:murein DD-endopeptidase MepM/ murein hydrolase activator NlpD
MFRSNKNKKIKKKYKNSKLHFIMFLTSEKPINLSISKWIVYTGLIVLLLTIVFGSIFSYNTYNLKMKLDDSLSSLEKEIQKLNIDKVYLDVENKSLKSSLDEKSEKVESALTEIESLQDSIKKIKMIVGLPVDDENDEDSSDKENDNSKKPENDSSNKSIIFAQSMGLTLASRGNTMLRDFDSNHKENNNVDDKDRFNEIDELISGTKAELEELLYSAEDREQYLKDVPIHFPTNGRITSPFGQRWGRLHKGLDISNNTGTKIYAAGSGVVLESRYSYSYGHSVLIEHKNGFKTRYAHLSKRLVKQGDEVSQADLIGLMGNTGTSYGSHLHYEIYLYGKAIDPLKIAEYLKYNE